MRSTYQIIEALAEKGLTYQGKDGAMPAGHNGPYFDPETPVRNTSHWAITFLKAWEISGKVTFKGAAIRCLDYLLKTDLRSQYTFVHRNKEGKDQCNGLIGSAWNIEALIEGFRRLDNEKYLNLALDLFLAHPFDVHKKVWYRVEPNGQVLSVDTSFNHQFWFFATAAPLSKVTKQEEVNQRLNLFAEHVEKHLYLYSSDRINHVINFSSLYLKERVKFILKPTYYKKRKLKEIGYHAFNTYAFALAYHETPQLSFFSTQKFKRTLRYLNSQEYLKYIPDSIYGFPYNPPGFEIAYTALTFEKFYEEKIDVTGWIKKQLDMCLNERTQLMERRTEDIQTATARVYELTRLPEIML